MAEKKAARPAAKHAAAKKKNKTGSSRGGRKTQSQPRDVEAMRRHNQVVAIVLFAVSILLGCLVLIPGDVVWRWIHDFILGLFGFLSILWPILLCYISVMIALGRSAKPKAGFKMILIVAIMVLLCGTVYIFQFGDSQKGISFWTKLGSLYQSGTEARSAGLFSGLIGVPFVAVLGSVGAKVVSILLLFVAGHDFYGRNARPVVPYFGAAAQSRGTESTGTPRGEGVGRTGAGGLGSAGIRRERYAHRYPALR